MKTSECKTVWCEGADGDLSRVTPVEAQRRIETGEADLIKFEGKIKRIRMTGKQTMHVSDDARGILSITRRTERAQPHALNAHALQRRDFEEVVRDRGATDRKAILLAGKANPWTVATLLRKKRKKITAPLCEVTA